MEDDRGEGEALDIPLEFERKVTSTGAVTEASDIESSTAP
jgi:hypothetical protein